MTFSMASKILLTGGIIVCFFLQNIGLTSFAIVCLVALISSVTIFSLIMTFSSYSGMSDIDHFGSSSSSAFLKNTDVV